MKSSLCWVCHLLQETLTTYRYLFYQWSNFRVHVTLSTQGVVWIRWRSRKILKIRVHVINITKSERYLKVCDFYYDFLVRWLLLTRKLLNHGFLLVTLKSRLESFPSPRWLYYSLRNICISNYHVYVPLIAITIRSFPRPWYITRFVARVIREMSLFM